jgi:hypothetical protein
MIIEQQPVKFGVRRLDAVLEIRCTREKSYMEKEINEKRRNGYLIFIEQRRAAAQRASKRRQVTDRRHR